jgi:hypothetical protein
MTALLLLAALLPARDDPPFRDVQIDPAFRPYLQANLLLMETTGAKVVKLPDGNYLLLGVASTVLKNDGAEERVRAERVCHLKVLEDVVGTTQGVQIASVQTSGEKIEVTVENGGKKVKSVATYLDMTEARVRGVTKDMPVVGRWYSKDGKVFYLALAARCDKKGNPVDVPSPANGGGGSAARPSGSWVEEPLGAIVVMENRARRWVYLVALTAEEMRYKESVSGDKVLREAAGDKKVRAIQTADGAVYARNAKTGCFERIAPPVVVLVRAEGVGSTPEDALKDAFRGAVRRAVGTVVDAETLVKNKGVVSDTVLTYSNGYIKAYQEVDKREDKGVFRTTIKAVVERQGLERKLRAEKISVQGIDGRGLRAAVVSELEAEENAKKLLEKALEAFPVNVYQLEFESAEVVERTRSSVTLRVKVRFRADPRAYGLFALNLVRTLNGIARDRGQLLLVAGADTGTESLPVRRGRRRPVYTPPQRQSQGEVWLPPVSSWNPLLPKALEKYVGVGVLTSVAGNGRMTG